MKRKFKLLLSLVLIILLVLIGLMVYNLTETTSTAQVIEKEYDNGDKKNMWIIVDNPATSNKEERTKIHIDDSAIWNLIHPGQNYVISYKESSLNNKKTLIWIGESDKEFLN